MPETSMNVDIVVPNQTRYLRLIGNIAEQIAKELDTNGYDQDALAYHLNLVLTEAVANAIEADFAARADVRVRRPVNLDPGYVEESKLVLASMKNFSHRIYLGRGVYAELTLMYRGGAWCAMPWTFPDFASGRYDAFLNEARRSLRAGKRQEP